MRPQDVVLRLQRTLLERARDIVSKDPETATYLIHDAYTVTLHGHTEYPPGLTSKIVR